MNTNETFTRRLDESVPASWSTASIADARAFRVGKSRKVHKPARFTPVRVVGACGVVGYTWAWATTRPAKWADSLITCPTCKAKG